MKRLTVPQVEFNTESDMNAAEMAAAATEETPALSVENVPAAEANDSSNEEKEKGRAETDIEEPGSTVEPKMEAGEAEASEENPVVAADKAASEAMTDGSAVTVNQEASSTPEEPEHKPESQQSPGDGNNEPASDNTTKEAKEEPGEESRLSGTDCEKSKTVCEDAEKASGGGGELGGKRRPSVEMSSSDGEPLSRLDSEDRLVGEMSGCFCLTLGVNRCFCPHLSIIFERGQDNSLSFVAAVAETIKKKKTFLNQSAKMSFIHLSLLYCHIS